MAGGIEHSVEVVGCTNQAKMSKGLWEVPQMLSGRTEFFGIQSKMVGVTECLFEYKARA